MVGTPGRIADLIRKRKVTAHTLKTIVIDEADNLLDNTSSPTVKDIIKATMRDRQLLVFSATINDSTLSLAKSLMKEPEVFKSTEKISLNPNISHMYIEVDKREKSRAMRFSFPRSI